MTILSVVDTRKALERVIGERMGDALIRRATFRGLRRMAKGRGRLQTTR